MTHPTKPDDPAAAYWKMRHSLPYRKKIMHLRDSKRGARKAALALAIMCAVTASPLSSPAFSATPSPGDFRVATENGVENQYLVTLKTQPESLEDRKNIADDIARQYNGKVRFVFESAMNGFSVSMSEADARRLAENTVVEYVEQDVEITEEYAPAIEGAKPQAVETEASWNMDRIDQRKRPLDGKFNAKILQATEAAPVRVSM
ncbi:protease inhibitor I9 family protein [Streptomyces sp. NPDC088748]|uniref:protease inhibitor I9 family protein n=1 Tax=Streptomyces sp. NPDC088748 TaxID=3365887 RepID=UPI0037F1EF67